MSIMEDYSFPFPPFLIYTKNSEGNHCLIPLKRNVIISFQNILYSLWLNHKSSCPVNREALLWIIKNSCRSKNYKKYMYKVYVTAIIDKKVSLIFISSSTSEKNPTLTPLKEHIVWEADLILLVNCSLFYDYFILLCRLLCTIYVWFILTPV